MKKMKEPIFKYIALEKDFYKGKYRYTRVVGGSQTKKNFLSMSRLPLIPNVNKLRINDTFIEEDA
ncbi:MAG: hypothetical protein CBC71_01220 [Rhodobacteraceae bacterium TMED111]|nr:MAG: hypothetical protein CBC71_01220 [Rhodobacteraceae bacterium TMED111]|tara:strand:+ start:19430 stop:19624 length:195 start_codon:yes stop_codon:yes gene_type:complete